MATGDGQPHPVCLITGASSGVGRAVAMRLAKRGWRLALAARGAEALESVAKNAKTAGAAGAIALPADVGDLVQARRLVRRTVDAFGRIDAVVNNAGCADLAGVAQTDDQTLRRDFAVNAMGPGAIISEAFAHFAAQRSGRIVNVSTMGTDDPFPGFFSYAASKAALNLYAKSCAAEGAELGIYAFSVAPGAVETPMLRRLFDREQIPESATLDPDEVAEVIVACLAGDRDEDNGRTIFLPNPAPAEG